MGFEAFYVETPRQHDAGMLIVGDTIVNFGDTPSNGAPPFEIGHLPKGLDYIHRQVRTTLAGTEPSERSLLVCPVSYVTRT